MQNLRKRSFQKESDLLKVYREADARAKYLNDTDEKLLSFNKVIDFCSNSEKCLENRGVKKNQILFWTYKRIGDLFLQKNADAFERQNNFNALAAYQKALEFSNAEDETLNILMKIRDIYADLEDKNGIMQSRVEITAILDDAFKIEMLLDLANKSESRKEEIYFLEQALKFASKEKISVLKKCKNTLVICDRLLAIYEKANAKADLARIEAVKKEAREILQQ